MCISYYVIVDSVLLVKCTLLFLLFFFFLSMDEVPVRSLNFIHDYEFHPFFIWNNFSSKGTFKYQAAWLYSYVQFFYWHLSMYCISHQSPPTTNTFSRNSGNSLELLLLLYMYIEMCKIKYKRRIQHFEISVKFKVMTTCTLKQRLIFWGKYEQSLVFCPTLLWWGGHIYLWSVKPGSREKFLRLSKFNA